MILVDSGALVALFDPRVEAHAECRRVLHGVSEPLVTTVPVLTEIFHLLDPSSRGALAVQEFVAAGG